MKKLLVILPVLLIINCMSYYKYNISLNETKTDNFYADSLLAYFTFDSENFTNIRKILVSFTNETDYPITIHVDKCYFIGINGARTRLLWCDEWCDDASRLANVFLSQFDYIIPPHDTFRSYVIPFDRVRRFVDWYIMPIFPPLPDNTKTIALYKKKVFSLYFTFSVQGHMFYRLFNFTVNDLEYCSLDKH